MLKTSLYFNCAALLLLVPAGLLAQNARHVDPFLGTDGGGNTFPGAVLPFGMVKADP
jgi:putative alpha-1,2-mannosidase